MFTLEILVCDVYHRSWLATRSSKRLLGLIYLICPFFVHLKMNFEGHTSLFERSVEVPGIEPGSKAETKMLSTCVGR